MAEDDEQMLLERLFLRIGSADTDEQFESIIKKFLTPILLKLSSPGDGVRKKVMELLVHVNKRLKDRSKIQLPMEDLIKQYLDPAAPAFVTNFSILYIKMGYPRLEAKEQAALLPQMISCLEGKPEAQQNSILQLLMPVLPHVEMPSKPEDKVAQYGHRDQPKVREKLLEHMLEFLLLPYNYAAHQERAKAVQNTAAQSSETQQAGQSGAGPTQGTAQGDTPAAPAPTFNGPPPAMSEASLKKVIGDSRPSPEEIEKIKQGIVEFLSARVFPKEEILIHLLVATADTRYGVATAGDRELKRMADTSDWNSPAIVSKLYSIFQGTVAVKGKPMKMKPEVKRAPASVQLRLKILPYLLRTREAANQFPACVQIVFDCLYGANTNAKLRKLAVQFVHHLCQHCDEAKFRPMGAVLLSGMVKLIGEAKEDSKLRMQCYVAAGKISKRLPQLVTRDMTLLQNFFDAISKESGETRLAVQESLSLMSEAFKDIDAANAKLVEALIMQNVEKEEPQARQMAVEYARLVFPPDHIPSRYVLLLAAGDSKDEIGAVATKALWAPFSKEEEPSPIVKPVAEVKVKGRPVPTFTDMIKYIQDQGKQRVKSQRKYVLGNNVLPFNPKAYAQIVRYLRLCLACDAGIESAADSLTDMMAQTPVISRHLRTLLGPGTEIENTVIASYIQIIRQLLTAVAGELPMYCLLELVAMERQRLAPMFLDHLDWVKNFMYSSKETLRPYAAELYALVVATAQDKDQQARTIVGFTEEIKKQALEGQHGCIACLGLLIGYLSAQKAAAQGDIVIEDMETDEDETIQAAIKKGLLSIVGMLDDSQNTLKLGACAAIGEIGRCGSLPLPDDSDSGWSKLKVTENLLKKVQAGNENPKVREQAALSVGYLCIGERGFPHGKKVLEGLLDSAAAKQLELHLTIGDALVCAALSTTSPKAQDKWTASEEDVKQRQHKLWAGESGPADEVDTLLELLLTKYSCSQNPYVRQAACIWLVSVAKQCGSHPVVQQKLKDIQRAFMNLLAESDELTQDLASKGLGVVYEICGEDMKQDLVTMLVDTLTSGRRKKQDVTGDTKVFETGAMGKTPDGQSISTYRELCSIANDLNQPDLIYKFMHLANHNAVWNSKKGAAFGFATIAAQAGEQLAPYLNKIIPKLYRYQFDPNPKIQQAMSSIWSALVPKTKETVDKYLPEIMADVQHNLVSNQWRTRESSCMAVNDLLRGRALDEVVDALPVLWENLLRVRDDIKESVRNAADLALRALSRASIKICDPNYGKVGDKATGLVLPCLLKTGLGSSVKEVQEISLTTILKISKCAGSQLKPHIPMLTVALLESLSTLEPQLLSYVSLHMASNSEASMQKFDSYRVAASKTSPMMDTINLCVQYMDSEILSELVPRLVDLIRSSVGLATKAGAANLVITLSHQCPKDLAPHAGKLLGALLNGLNDRNPTIKKSYASTIGNLVKVAKDSSVEKLIARLQEWYMTKEEESLREVCGVTLQAMNRHSGDILRRHSASALPLAFLAMHQQQDANTQQAGRSAYEPEQSTWEEVWLDVTPGTEAGIRLYLPEIVALSQQALQSQSWSLKAQGAATMATIGEKLGSGLGPPHLGLVLRTLMDRLSGRTWAGKERLLKAIAMICKSCSVALLTPPAVPDPAVTAGDEPPAQPSPSDLLAVLLREARKESLPYKGVALSCTADVVHALQMDAIGDVTGIIVPRLEKHAEDQAKKKEARGSKEEESEDRADEDTWLEFEEICYQSLATAWPTSKYPQTQEQFQDQFTTILCDALRNSVWKVELSALKALHTFVQRLASFESAENYNRNATFIASFFDKLSPLLSKSIGAVVMEHISPTNLDLLVVALKNMAKNDSQMELRAKAADLLKTLHM